MSAVKGVLHVITDDLDAGVVDIVMPFELGSLEELLAAYAGFLDYLAERGDEA